MSANDNEGKQNDEITDTTKVTILFAGITNVYINVRGGCMWSSAKMGYVDSWRRSSRGDTARCLMLVS